MTRIARLLRIAGGFTLLAFGIALLVLPGPGWLMIAAGLALLAAEFAWARYVQWGRARIPKLESTTPVRLEVVG